MVCRDHLAAAQVQAEVDQEEARKVFQRWATAWVPAAKHMNVASGAQIQQLLFAGVRNAKDSTQLGHARVFKARVFHLRKFVRFTQFQATPIPRCLHGHDLQPFRFCSQYSFCQGPA